MAIGLEDIPRRLYKYFAPDRVESLDNGMLRYTPLCAFNDPFEGRPDVSDLTPPHDFLKALEVETSAQAKASYDQLTNEQKNKLSYATYVDLFSGVLAAKRAEFVSLYSAISVDMKTKILSSMDTHVGALCLTEEPTNILMWPHYAQNHEGFVVEFDAHHDYFHGQRSEQDEFHRLRRVNYRRQRPNLDFNDINGIVLFLIKSSDWAYENEWRLLKPLADASRRIDANPYPIDLFTFPRGVVKSVILGARSRPETASRIREILASHDDYAAVQIRRAVADPKEFRLSLQDESRSP